MLLLVTERLMVVKIGASNIALHILVNSSLTKGGVKTMSFNVEFVAESAADAKKIVAEEYYLPESVKDFLNHALSAYPTGMVSVKATGHLYNNDYKVSTATIEVKGIGVRHPVMQDQVTS